MASIELLDEETLNVTLSDDIGLESNINEPESINVEQLPNDYTPSYTESDPIFVSSPAASIKEDDITNWNSKSDFDGDYESLTNKPTIPTVPTNLSSFTDDLGSSPTHTHNQYLTEHQDISVKVDKETGKGLSSNDFTDTYKSNVDSNTVARHTHNNKSVLDDISSSDVSSWDNKQEALVSGENIKTINNQSLLGSGNITIQGGSGGNAEWGSISGTLSDQTDLITALNERAKIFYVYREQNDYTKNQIVELLNEGYEIHLKYNDNYLGSIKPIFVLSVYNDYYMHFTDVASTTVITHTYNFTTNTWSRSADYLVTDDIYDEIPTKTSDLTNDSGFITNYTETDPVFTSSAAHEITSTDITNWNNKSTFSGSYNDLTNKPTIPDELSDLSDDSTHRLVTDTEKSIWNAKSDFSGSYNDLTDTPTIPTKTSDLTNDSSYITATNYASNQTGGTIKTDTSTYGTSMYSGYLTGSTRTYAQYQSAANALFVSKGTLENVITGKQLASASDIPTKTSDLTNDSGFITDFGNAKTYYGTSDTGALTAAKVVACSDFVLETGATIFVKFTNANTYNGTATLDVNSTGAKDIARVGTTKTTRYYWTAGEVVGFVYDGTNYVMIDKGTATTTYYGMTKLSSSTSSTSEALAATPKAVKAAYDLANSKQDEITSTNKLDYSLIDNTPTIPTVPTNLSSFTDDLGSSPTHTHSQYLTSHQDISGKVDKETGKGLSSNDFTTTYKNNVDSNTSARHTHSNKAVLDGISSSDITNWNEKQAALVSGTNIKTINSQSLLGNGDISFDTIQEISGESSIRIANLDAGIYKIDGGENGCNVYYNSNDSLFVASLSYAYLIVAQYEDLYINNNWAFIGNGFPDFHYGYSWSSHGYCFNVTSEEAQAAIIGTLSDLTTTAKTNLVSAINELDSDKQDSLVSGTNIKTINNQSILGSGNITINSADNLATALGLDTDTYNASSTYNSGDLVIYNSTIYECNTDNTTGAWNSSKWDLVPIIVND